MCDKNTLYKLVEESALEPFEKIELGKIIKGDDSASTAVLVLLSIRVGNYAAQSADRDKKLEDGLLLVNTRCKEQCQNLNSWKFVIMRCSWEITILGTIAIFALVLRPELKSVIDSMKGWF